jgi:hypothetical protein
MRRLTLLRTAIAPLAAAAVISGCGPSPAAAVVTDPPASATTPWTPTPAGTAAATTAPMPADPSAPPKPRNALDITQEHIRMLVPNGLTWVSYTIDRSYTLDDVSGGHHTVIPVLLSTPQLTEAIHADPSCGDWGTALVALEIYDVDPATVQDGPFSHQALARVDGRYLTLDVPDGGFCNAAAGAVAEHQLPLLEQMVRTAAPLR